MDADAVMQCPTYRGLFAISSRGRQTWFYRFEYNDMKYGKYLGSFHAAELPFIFQAFDRAPFYKRKQLDREMELSRIMQGYWSNFARTGDPNGPGLPEWEAFAAADQKIQILDTDGVSCEDAGVVERCGFWEDYARDFLPFANKLINSLF